MDRIAKISNIVESVRQAKEKKSGKPSYLVTGALYRTNKKFKLRFDDIKTAMSINLWNGRVWEVSPEGKRKIIKRVSN